ncbi:MerR family transcriptional regulator [Staphylococcus gallinarum]|uniref:MerR family transcriptional regulator n=1 Tax=Staphylococcus gallinarum TaxID=1293 RepID=UPI000E6810D8|nr:MerR family transcriptional regulator [Staphylococcus gallinarum]RIL20952.1 MerR family transcriptional regulator [Staphylococcus gallinarum]
MTLYQTGDLAKICNVSVRTIQYYDNKGLLNASSNNGRRYFDKNSKEKLEMILILKSFGFKLKDIKLLFDEKVELNVIRALINEKLVQVEEEIHELKTLEREMKQYQKYISEGSTESYTKLIDTQQYIKENMKHRKLPMAFTSKLITLFVAQYSFVIYSMYKKSWKPILFNLPPFFLITTAFTYKYYKSVEYLCPNCQQKFIPEFITWTLARHTPKTRALKCPNCYETNDWIAMKK